MKWTPKVGDWFILKSSYCGKRAKPRCTDARPCAECLKLCNRFVISAEHYGRHWFFGGGWCTRTDSNICDETYSAVLTLDRAEVDGVRGIHHVSEAMPIEPPPRDQR